MELPALILIHGYPFDHTLWNLVVERLRPKIHVIAPDLPGFGGTRLAAGEPSMDTMADSIADLMARKNLEEAVVGGMSMGGYIALSFAERYPEKLAGLALISTQTAADSEGNRKGRYEMIEKVRREGVQAASAGAIPKLFSPANEDREELRKYATDGAKNAGVDAICWALEAMARRPDRTALLGKITVPSLVLHGAEDKFIPADRARQMAEALPDSEFIEVPNAGHGLPIEAPEIVANALFELVERAHYYALRTPPPHKKTINRPPVVISPTDQGL